MLWATVGPILVFSAGLGLDWIGCAARRAKPKSRGIVSTHSGVYQGHFGVPFGRFCFSPQEKEI